MYRKNAWKEYTEELNVNAKDVIKAKAIDKDGEESEVSTYTITAISDAINLNAHDDNYTSIDTIAVNKNNNP